MKSSHWYTAVILIIPTIVIVAFLLYVTVDWDGFKQARAAATLTSGQQKAQESTGPADLRAAPYAVRFYAAVDVSLMGILDASSCVDAVSREWNRLIESSFETPTREGISRPPETIARLQLIYQHMQYAVQNTRQPPAAWQPAHAELLNLYTDAAAMIESAADPSGTYMSFTSTAQARTGRITDAANRILVLAPQPNDDPRSLAARDHLNTAMFRQQQDLNQQETQNHANHFQ